MEIVLQANTADLREALNKFPKAVLENTLSALEIGIRDIQERAREKHDFTTRTGNLDLATQTDINRETLTGVVGIDTKRAPYGLAQHDGSGIYGPTNQYYEITPKQKKALRWSIGGGSNYAFSKHVFHPGVKPTKYITKAAKDEEQRINERFGVGIAKAAKGTFV